MYYAIVSPIASNDRILLVMTASNLQKPRLGRRASTGISAFPGPNRCLYRWSVAEVIFFEALNLYVAENP
jgi:hypothetical protein